MIYDDLPLEHGDFPVQKALNNQRVRHQNQHFVGRPSHPRPTIPSRVVSITPPKRPLSRPSHLELGGQTWLTVRIFGLCMVFSYLTLFNNRFPNGSVIIVLPTLFILILVSMTSFFHLQLERASGTQHSWHLSTLWRDREPRLVLFCNNPKLFGPNYKIYLENKIRQDVGWFSLNLYVLLYGRFINGGSPK